jgi:hypothetical protein
MAEEGNLGLGRAAHERDDDEPSKEELQRRMAEARESITQTVTEIKETVTNQYYSMKESVSDALDWRHHFRKNPIAFSVGALSVGFLVGYGLAGAFKGNGHEEREGSSASPEETDLFARTGATPQRYEDESVRHSSFHGHSYAAQPITDGPHEMASQEDERSSAQPFEESEDEHPARGANYAYSAPRLEEEEDNKPSLLDRFKETSAYDRLQTEVSSLGDRFIDELSKTAHNVVLPALFNKIKELFGVDLSGKQGQGRTPSSQEGATRPQTTGATAPGPNAQAASASASLGSASRGGSSYATSENRSYGNQSSEGAAANRNQDDSVLDLDR